MYNEQTKTKQGQKQKHAGTEMLVY